MVSALPKVGMLMLMTAIQKHISEDERGFCCIFGMALQNELSHRASCPWGPRKTIF